MAAGFTYFDTAYGYLGGKSEEAVKTAIVDRYPRESFTLATKLPAWAGAKTAEEAKEMFYTSLRRTGAGYFDFYLLHNLAATGPKFSTTSASGTLSMSRRKRASSSISDSRCTTRPKRWTRC